MITLTAEERDKFAAWCEQEAESNRGILQQIEAVGLDEILLEIRALDHIEMAACIFVATKLRMGKTTDD